LTLELLDHFVRHVLSGASRGGWFQQQTELVDLNEPILGARANHRPHVHPLGDDAIGDEPRQRLNHRRATDAQGMGELRRLQFAAAGKLAADDARQDLAVDVVDARELSCVFGESQVRRLDIGRGQLGFGH
jgi:hypothetical protein